MSAIALLGSQEQFGISLRNCRAPPLHHEVFRHHAQGEENASEENRKNL